MSSRSALAANVGRPLLRRGNAGMPGNEEVPCAINLSCVVSRVDVLSSAGRLSSLSLVIRHIWLTITRVHSNKTRHR